MKPINHSRPCPPSDRKERGSTLAKTLSACALLFCVTPAVSAAEADQRPDDQIVFAVERALMFDSAVKAEAIDLLFDDGVVTLNGSVDTLLNYERAAKIARQIRGVTSVVNRLEVLPSSLRDRQIRTDVRDALLFDPATESYEIEVFVKESHVTLEGKVSSWQEKQLAEHEVKGVRGVVSLDNNLFVAYPLDRADAEILADAKRFLATDIWTDHDFIDVEVDDGEVFLSGSVGSAAAADRAQTLVWTTGVKSVNTENLTVEPWLDVTDKRNRPVDMPDPKIRDAIVRALAVDPRVYSFDPHVTVDRGVVTLTGVVDNLKAKKAAEQDALNTVGVRRVENLLKVRSDQSDVETLTESRIAASLARNSITDGYDINVAVDGGVVTLRGTVDSALEKSEAEDVAQRARGVYLVRNQLEVDYPAFAFYNYAYDPFWSYMPYYIGHSSSESSQLLTVDARPLDSDRIIRERVQSELFWSPFVDSDDVSVRVEDATVTLTGTVEDFAEQSTAIENAYEGGAKLVINDLIIIPPSN